ncbi:MAG: N-acetylmuramoyl-L-alanine amidase LytC precursor [Firmicutes bacterium ADurb.Bin419]|nr:MAG: N-acetylmuramoyl-L-alanine amidase LytC precursor [Firmicutes bacterium ADurb.Bin419]
MVSNMVKIMIDPGHGGTDRSNRGPTGYIEADGVLDISLKLRDELLSTGAFDVKLSRDKDMTLGVRERGNMAAKWGADMFISEHSNATCWANNTTKRGVDVFYSVDIPNDKVFANNMSKAVSEAMGTKNNGGYTWESKNYPGEDYLGVIDAAQDGGVKHVILIESGFHDNLQDEAILKDPAKRLAIAKAQAKVICEFYGVKYPVTTTTSITPDTTTSSKITVEYEGQKVTTTVDPIIIDGRTMICARDLADAMGLDIGWDAATRTVSLSKK